VPGFAGRATGWLLDLCPAEYRGYPLLQRHPLALAWLAGRHVAAAARAADVALASARGDLAGRLPPEGIGELIEILEREQARLRRTGREVGLVEQALRGERYVPRL
jgi:hypothetical protein